MNIGFVSTWFERGAAYVTRNYMNLLKDKHNVYVYARGGEEMPKTNSDWNLPNVTWGLKLPSMYINFNHFKKWLKKNKIDTIFFNEQQQIEIVYQVKRKFPNIKLGSYIDYYKENTLKTFYIFDFLICNTKRHFSVFKEHPQCYYVPWGTDIELFKPNKEENSLVTFFHSAGHSNRKGTSFVIEAFIKGEIYKKAKLIIHTQKNFEKNFNYNIKELKNYNIDIIEKTVKAPGLYYLGDVYVYPTMLDGLGLTMYEALASGLPVITTDHPPMNEVINNNVGYLVDVDYFRSRKDGYYWPLSIIKLDALVKAMDYFIKNPYILKKMKKNARMQAEKNWNWSNRKKVIEGIFENAIILDQQVSDSYIDPKNKLTKIKRKLGSSYLYSFWMTIKK